MSAIEWPSASLDPIRRARVIGAAIPSAAWAEAVIDAPYAETWAWLTEFEHSVPRFDRQVQRIRVHERSRDDDGVEQVRLTATSFGVRQPFAVRVEDGFCLMRGRGRLYLVVMAAVPLDGGSRTRFFHLEAVPLSGFGVLRSLLQHDVDADLGQLRRIAESGF
jgi:hypothetical protein